MKNVRNPYRLPASYKVMPPHLRKIEEEKGYAAARRAAITQHIIRNTSDASWEAVVVKVKVGYVMVDAGLGQEVHVNTFGQHQYQVGDIIFGITPPRWDSLGNLRSEVS